MDLTLDPVPHDIILVIETHLREPIVNILKDHIEKFKSKSSKLTDALKKSKKIIPPPTEFDFCTSYDEGLKIFSALCEKKEVKELIYFNKVEALLNLKGDYSTFVITFHNLYEDELDDLMVKLEVENIKRLEQLIRSCWDSRKDRPVPKSSIYGYLPTIKGNPDVKAQKTEKTGSNAPWTKIVPTENDGGPQFVISPERHKDPLEDESDVKKSKWTQSKASHAPSEKKDKVKLAQVRGDKKVRGQGEVEEIELDQGEGGSNDEVEASDKVNEKKEKKEKGKQEKEKKEKVTQEKEKKGKGEQEQEKKEKKEKKSKE